MSHPADAAPPDARAKDLLPRWPIRRVVGAGLGDRVGARGWKPPRFARAAAIYARLGLANPWDPDAVDKGTGIGEVALPTRQPAPHLTPPAPPKAAPRTGPNLPPASIRREAAPESAIAARIGEVRKADANEFRAAAAPVRPGPPAPPPRPTTPSPFGPGPVHHPVVKLPVRPGVVAPSAEPPAPPPAPARPVPVSRPAPVAPPPSAAAPPRPAPPAPLPLAPLPPPPPEAAAAPPPKPPAPVNRKPPGPPAGLDDLFGMGGGENTRIKLPKPEAEGEAPRPRRPMVSSPEELARLGFDRRPPPAKAPNVPAAPAPPPPREPEPE